MNLNNFIGKDSPGKMGHKNHPLQTGWYSVVQQAFSCIIKLTQQLACSATSLMLLMLRSGTGFRPARNAELGIIMEWYLLYINRLQTVDCSCLKPANSYLGSVWCPLSMGELCPVKWAGPPSCVQEYTRISCEGTPPYHLSCPSWILWFLLIASLWERTASTTGETWILFHVTREGLQSLKVASVSFILLYPLYTIMIFYFWGESTLQNLMNLIK